MSGTARVLLIVFGGLAVMIVGGFILLIMLASWIAHGSNDPASTKRVTAAFGTFVVPHGYRVQLASDLFFTQMLMIDRAHAAVKPNAFSIVLMRVRSPGASQEAFEKRLTSTDRRASIARCRHVVRFSPEPIASRIGSIVLNRRLCADGPRGMERATAFFRSKGAVVIVSAIGRVGDFDVPALRALLASFR